MSRAGALQRALSMDAEDAVALQWIPPMERADRQSRSGICWVSVSNDEQRVWPACPMTCGRLKIEDRRSPSWPARRRHVSPRPLAPPSQAHTVPLLVSSQLLVDVALASSSSSAYPAQRTHLRPSRFSREQPLCSRSASMLQLRLFLANHASTFGHLATDAEPLRISRDACTRPSSYAA